MKRKKNESRKNLQKGEKKKLTGAPKGARNERRREQRAASGDDHNTLSEFEISVLGVFHKNPTAVYNPKQVNSRLDEGKDDDASRVQAALDKLVEREQLLQPEPGRYKAAPQSQYIVGKMDFTSSGAAYLVPEDKEKYVDDIYIPATATGKSLHGDKVRVYVFRRKQGRRPEGEVVEIISRVKNQFVGRLELSQHFGFVIPDNNRIAINFYIPKDGLGEAKDGDKVVVEIAEWPDKVHNPVGRILDVLGRPGEHEVEIHSILAEYGLPYHFPEEIEEEASKLPIEITQEEIGRRRDMRTATTFTIDPADAKDFDDALSIDRLENGNYLVGIHIADVSHYVKEGTDLDEEAYDRGTSVYLVDRVVPMLPEILSNNVCSLRPDEEKLTFSAVFEMDEEAHVKNEWFGRTVILSNRRFTYEEAQAVIEGGDDPLKDEILTLDRLAKKMRERRIAAGAISFDKEEVKFILDKDNEPTGVYFKIAKDSNKLIEEFMLLANRKVAAYVGSELRKDPIYKGIAPTFVYRVHDDPNPEKLAALAGMASKFGYKVVTKDRQTIARSLNRMLTDSLGRREENMLSTLAMRSMAKAEYSTDNIGHYGLAFDFYTHFTSPIRRYPDVMVHRLLQHYLDKGKSADKEKYEEHCKYSSARERVAADAERDSVKYMQVKYMAKHVDKEYKGVISGVTEWGIYVEIIENKCEGMVRLRDIRDDYYSFDAKNFAAVGENSHNVLQLGDEVIVKVKNADLERKQLDFEFIRVAEQDD